VFFEVVNRVYLTRQGWAATPL